MQFIEIGRGLTVGIDIETRALRRVLIEDFGEKQRVFGVDVSTKSCGNEFMRALNAIHLKYFEDLEPEEFSKFAGAAVARLGALEQFATVEREAILVAGSNLVATYRRHLELEQRKLSFAPGRGTTR